MPANLQKEHKLGAGSPRHPNNTRRLLRHFSQRKFRTSTIPSILQVPQWLARRAGGNANTAFAPHTHLGDLMSTISGNLHFAQQLG
eukprot:CAMPEP_0183524400 /NCGR_PEP_ID=MMETSP0371-20130417/19867_1 /TAXON_ID=268820 /ORGANISM="Peridinium aciculiferum, Strain PAER-2" /LENGTH=85 /DNA_ID=CAMNT_0025723499 /DNA_START=26 /DNA_END=279 /DNA_ORIENTATION=+